MALPTASDNPFPSILAVETASASISSPAAGKQRLFVDTDHVLKYKNSGGTVSNVGSGSGSVATDTIWDAKGDLAGGTGADAASRLAVGSNGQVLTADSAQTTGLKWAASTGGGTKLYDFTISGSDQVGIDTNVDGTTVANFAGYDVLEWWLVGRTDDAGALPNISLIFNNDTGANYHKQYMAAVDTSQSDGSSLSQASFQTAFHGSGGTAAVPGMWRCSMPNYLGTTFDKVFEVFVGVNDGTAGNNAVAASVGTWLSTAAVTRIKMAGLSGAKLKVGSRLLVYGR